MVSNILEVAKEVQAIRKLSFWIRMEICWHKKKEKEPTNGLWVLKVFLFFNPFLVNVPILNLPENT